MSRRTKIVVTLGPASGDQDAIERLIRAGVNVVRLNFSHGTHEEHATRLKLVRETSQRLDHPVTILQDLQGPKIRTGELEAGSVNLEQGASLKLTTEPILGDKDRISVDFAELPNSVRPGSRILLDDGNLELAVVTVSGKQVETKVVLGGVLKSHKGVNLPGAKLNIPAFTEKDESDLAFGLEQQVDAIAMSFVRTPADVTGVQQKIEELNPERKGIPIIAKLERPEALDNLSEIIKVADGVMVARGDLGVEMSPEAVPIAQKQIIETANQHAKVVITATQMLDSMISKPRPTRAEATDVANAIFDGSDAVMLSGETAVGKFPVQAVKTMDAIICEAESKLRKWGHWGGQLGEAASEEIELKGTTHDDALSITRAARELADDRNVAAIAVFTQTGRTAQLMAKARPEAPILAFTPSNSTYRQLPLLWGVTPHLVPYADTLEAMLEVVEKTIVAETPIRPGQQVVLISGFPVGAMRPPNLAILHTIGESFH
ncbi:MAG TPA: pyruvate kinase [Anaerolineales bacterium]|nr:pyruvate kinase [Anaerolineales bacterium]